MATVVQQERLCRLVSRYTSHYVAPSVSGMGRETKKSLTVYLANAMPMFRSVLRVAVERLAAC